MKKTLLFILISALILGTLCSCGTDVSEIVGYYGIQKNIYYDTLVDRAYNPDDGFTVLEKDGKTMLFINHVSISGETISNEIGTLKSFTLKKSNFDELIFGEAWQDGESAANIRKENKSSWKAENKSGDSYYILLQNDGGMMIACVKTKDGIKSCAYIRKMISGMVIPV